MTVLILDDEARQQIQEIKLYAENNFFTLEQLRKIIEAKESIGNDPRFSCIIETGFRVVFTIEQHPGGWMKHFSASVNNQGRYPNEEAVGMLMTEFGFTRNLRDCHVFLEKSEEAVNVLEPVDTGELINGDSSS